MSAFVSPLNLPVVTHRGFALTHVSQRRPAFPRVATELRFSLTTNEALAVDGTATPIPPSPPRERENRPRPQRERPKGPPRPPFELDPNATYFTTCGHCQASYEIKPDTLGPRGSRVQCSVCGNQWFQRLDRLSVLREGQGLKDYPMDKKDEMIAEKAQERNNRASRGRRDRWRAEHKVFVGNLPFSCSQEKLEELFREVNIHTDRVSIVMDADGRSRGFAFAELRSREDVDRAVETLNGTELSGRNLTVKVGK